MGFSSKTEGRTGSLLTRVFACAALFATLLAGGLYRLDAPSDEGVVYEAVCRQVLSNTTEGRQALVSSAWWPPLPTLLRLPVAALADVDAGPLASAIVSGLFGAFILLLVNRAFRDWNVGPLRFLLLIALVAWPPFLKACFDGSSTTTAVYLAVLVAFSLVQWIATRNLRFLIYVAFGTALLCVTSFEMIPWVLLVFGLVVVDQVVRGTSRWYKEAVFILALFPTIYVVGLWWLMNWLIMGQGGYFYRALFAGARAGLSVSWAAMPDGFDVAAVALCACLLMAAWRQKARGGAYLAVLGVAPLAFALWLVSHDLVWSRGPLLASVFPLTLLVGGLAIGLMRQHMRLATSLLSLIPFGMALAALSTALADGSLMAAGNMALKIREESYSLAPRIERHVRDRSPYASVFVCGYDGFRFLPGRAEPVFISAMDFDFQKARSDYPGHDLYMLVHKPVGRSRMDSIHWKFNGMYAVGAGNALYDGDWGDWRLFEIVQAPREHRERKKGMELTP